MMKSAVLTITHPSVLFTFDSLVSFFSVVMIDGDS